MMVIESIINIISISPEVLFAVGGFMFNLLVLPTLINNDAAIPRFQSVASVFVLVGCFAIPYYWIGFYWSAVANVIGGVLWTLVAVYRSPDTPKSNNNETTSQNSVQPAD